MFSGAPSRDLQLRADRMRVICLAQWRPHWAYVETARMLRLQLRTGSDASRGLCPGDDLQGLPTRGIASGVEDAHPLRRLAARDGDGLVQFADA